MTSPRRIGVSLSLVALRLKEIILAYIQVIKYAPARARHSAVRAHIEVRIAVALADDVADNLAQRPHCFDLANGCVFYKLQRAQTVDALNLDGLDSLIAHIVQVGCCESHPFDLVRSVSQHDLRSLGRRAVYIKQVTFRHNLDSGPRPFHRFIYRIVAAVHRRDERSLTHRDERRFIIRCVVTRRPPSVYPHGVLHVIRVCESSLINHDSFLVFRL